MGKPGKRQPSGLFAEGESAPSLLARKEVQGPLQGHWTPIARTAESRRAHQRDPRKAKEIKACGDFSLLFEIGNLW